MNNLLKLKKWLTLSEAAKHLTSVIKVDVAESDVLKFALNGDLTLSVKFVNPAYGSNCVKYSENQEEAMRHCDSFFGENERLLVWDDGFNIIDENHISYLQNLHLQEDGRIWQSGDNLWQTKTHVRKLEGVWDLPMVGGERIEVEREYQKLTGGPEFTAVSKDSVFVKRPDGAFFEIQTSSKPLVEIECAPGYYDSKDFHSVVTLPKKRVFVIRSNAILDFIKYVNEESSIAEKIIDSSEIDTQLSTEESKFDPLDFPEELDAARMAFVVVKSGNGGTGTTFRNKLIDYLKKNYPNLGKDAVSRIATVANPDKTRGRKKFDKE
ncbi:hypothetical protein GALL_525960 [mine drainage metagenome]|uniref:Uncharacterized protein n=1 Tax=mine drainage metagenome TaxID=410659 RepID=A0A1J5P404_9ZZZZ